MDKRFFLALFLSLIVIAVSQLLFPPVRPKAPAKTATASDSISGTARTASTTAVGSVPSSGAVQRRSSASRADTSAVTVAQTAETTTVNRPKAIFRFSSVGAAPVSVVARDYQSRSALSSLVDLGVPGSPLLAYRLIMPTDTLDLSRVPFTLTQSTNAAGDETLSYTTTVKNIGISIAYTIGSDTAASYVVRTEGRISGAATPAYLVTELPKTLRPTEAD